MTDTKTDNMTIELVDVEPKTHNAPALQGSRELAAPPVAGPMGNALAFLQAGGDLAQLEKMMDLQDRFDAREAEKAFNAAFAAFKAEATNIVKTTKVNDGPLKGKSYANLADVVLAVTPAMSKHGLSAAWKLTKDEPQWMEVTCTLRHVGGHAESISMGGEPDTGPGRNKIQSRASTNSYLNRYTLLAILGMAAANTDDDGNGGPRDTVDPLSKIQPALLNDARNASLEGTASLQAFLASLEEKFRRELKPAMDGLKAAAELADKPAASTTTTARKGAR